MMNPLIELQDVPVEIICRLVTPPVIRNGRVTCQAEGPCEVVLEEPEPRLEPGMRVVLDGGPDRDLRIAARCAMGMGGPSPSGRNRACGAARQNVPFPGCTGGSTSDIVFLPAGEGEETASVWVSGGGAAGEEEAWREPDPFMDFSGTGLRFEDQPHCKAEDRVLIELRLPSSDLWRATARVVRVDPIRSEDFVARDEKKPAQAPTHQIAVQFVDLPADAAEALTAFGMRIQDALLKDLGPAKK